MLKKNSINKKYLVISISLCLFILVGVIGNVLLVKHNQVIQESTMNTGMNNYRLLYSEEEKILIVGTLTGGVVAYDAQEQMLWSFSTNNVISDLKITKDHQQVLVASEDRYIYYLDIYTGQVQNSINVQRPIYSIDIDQDNAFIVVSCGLSSMKSNLLLYTLQGEEVWNQKLDINGQTVTFSSDGQKILLGNNRGEVLTYDLQGNKIDSQKLNAPIIELNMLEDGTLSVLTQSGSLYKTTMSFDRKIRIDHKGEGKSLDVNQEYNLNILGLAQGDLFVYADDGSFIYQYYFDKVLYDIVTTDENTYIVAGSEKIYFFDNNKMETIVLTTNLVDILQILMILSSICLLISLILSFTFVRYKFVRFIRMVVKHRVAYIMLIPTFILLIVFCYIPVFTAFIRAFTDWNIADEKIRFIGLDNFVKMFEEGYFLMGVKNLAILTLTSFLKLLTVPLLVAELIFNMRGSKRKYWFRFLFVLPMVVPGIVGVLMWQNIYDPTIGLVNNLLEIIGRQDLQQVWLGNKDTAIWSIVFMGFPFVDAFAFLIYYGGLINIPGDIFESAKVEGSNAWHTFWKIKIPMIMPQLKMLIILNFIAQIQNFMPILILTGGGPGYSTYVPGLELYYNATRFGKYGYACALGLVMFIFIFGGTILNMKIQASKDV